MRWIVEGFSLMVGFILAVLNFELLALDELVGQLENTNFQSQDVPGNICNLKENLYCKEIY
jgi:hypothetical protein